VKNDEFHEYRLAAAIAFSRRCLSTATQAAQGRAAPESIDHTPNTTACHRKPDRSAALQRRAMQARLPAIGVNLNK